MRTSVSDLGDQVRMKQPQRMSQISPPEVYSGQSCCSSSVTAAVHGELVARSIYWTHGTSSYLDLHSEVREHFLTVCLTVHYSVNDNTVCRDSHFLFDKTDIFSVRIRVILSPSD